MRTDTNVADGDTPPAGAAMNKQLHPNLFVFDRDRTADGLLFVTGGDRCRYLGKSSREKPDWLTQNEGRYRSIEDVLREEAPTMLSDEAEINPGAGPAEPVDSSSSPEVRNDGNDEDDVASADPLLGDRSRPRESIAPPTPVKENAKKQKPPAGIPKSAPKLSPKIMRIVLNFLRERPILYLAALAAGIHPKTLAYWIRRSKAGDDGYDIEWQDVTGRFHEHCESAIDEAHQKLEDEWLQRALRGYEKVLTHRGRVVYKIDQELVGLGFQGPDAYLRDENGKPVPETVHKEDRKAQLHVLKRRRPDTWGKHPKRNAPRAGGVLVIGDVTNKPKYNTDKSVRARSWKADSRRIREEKD
jgi:hypothetical protein